LIEINSAVYIHRGHQMLVLEKEK